MSLLDAVYLVTCTSIVRIPEPIREADLHGRQLLRDQTNHSLSTVPTKYNIHIGDVYDRKQRESDSSAHYIHFDKPYTIIKA